MWTVTKIVSGGQTGVDRAALDWALSNDVSCGGWCPAGRVAEDGVIDRRYSLEETPGEGYSQRTAWNVRDSDGTLIFSLSRRLTGGTQLTEQLARKWKRPCLVLSKEEHPAGSETQAAAALHEFVDTNRIEILNVAGPRSSTESDAGNFAKAILDTAFSTS